VFQVRQRLVQLVHLDQQTPQAHVRWPIVGIALDGAVKRLQAFVHMRVVQRQHHPQVVENRGRGPLGRCLPEQLHQRLVNVMLLSGVR